MERPLCCVQSIVHLLIDRVAECIESEVFSKLEDRICLVYLTADTATPISICLRTHRGRFTTPWRDDCSGKRYARPTFGRLPTGYSMAHPKTIEGAEDDGKFAPVASGCEMSRDGYR